MVLISGMQSQSVENYLKTIYLLDRQGIGKVSATTLASALGVNPPSIIDMIKKLKEKQLIKYDKTNGVRLTGSGTKKALLMVRKHRLWEMFLHEKLRYSWDEIHDIAEQLEHVQDDKLADRLDKFLGFPEFDPHGEAIPRSNGQMPDINAITLWEAVTGKPYKVVSLKDTSKSFLQYLKRLDIGIGTHIKATEKIDFDNSLIILIEDAAKATVSEKFAENVFVSEV